MANASVRRWIRWVPNDATEPTSTLVLSSPAPHNHFVDIRILHGQSSSPPSPPGPESVNIDADDLKSLDWAFAGTSSRTTAPGSSDDGADVTTTGKWTHWVDSKVSLGKEAPPDEGRLFPYYGDDGEELELEKGSMFNPAAGEVQEYEELWGNLPLGAARPECLVLRTREDEEFKARGMVVRVGGWWQGILRRGEDVSVERWHCSDDEEGGKWTKLVRMGKLDLPGPEHGKVEKWKEGDEIVVRGLRWRVELKS